MTSEYLIKFECSCGGTDIRERLFVEAITQRIIGVLDIDGDGNVAFDYDDVWSEGDTHGYEYFCAICGKQFCDAESAEELFAWLKSRNMIVELPGSILKEGDACPQCGATLNKVVDCSGVHLDCVCGLRWDPEEE